MDPFSHAALGRTLAALGPEDRGRRALAVAATLGALAPDLDAVFMPFGWDVYLRVHEIGTHAAIGTLGCAILTAAIVRSFARSTPFALLAGAAWLGSASHVLLDLLSSARIRVLWPFIDRQVSIPLVAMADPWLATLLVAGVAATLLIRGSRRLAGIGLALCAIFLAAKAVLAARAVGAYREANDAGPGASIVQARWAALDEWHVFDRSGNRLRQWLATAAPRGARLVMSWPVGSDSGRVAASKQFPVVRNFLRAHQLVFATTLARPDRREWVLWSDIRFCWNPDRDGAPAADPIVEADGAKLACALWFGVEFDDRGRPRQQIVQIGRFMQTRGVDE
jgi:membrane-bound metal-dependent hydrolase YbcI (DUF457 family)